MHLPIALRSTRYTAGILPRLGGALAWFGLAGDPTMEFVRATPVRALHDGFARMASAYPLVPYSNRIGDGRFDFDGRTVMLRRNTDISEHPIHGIGFLRPWTVASNDDRALTLTLAHDGRSGDDPDWPWSFEAIQSFVLDDESLRICISITNRDPRAMPAGIGLHPFFPKSAATRLRFATGAVWLNDARMLPAARTAVPPAFDFHEQRTLDTLTVDNCFAGWDGNADIEWPDRQWKLRIAATSVFGHLVVFTSPARDAIAIEPVSHVNNALNLARARDDTGLVVLAPGATLEGTVTLSPSAIDG